MVALPDEEDGRKDALLEGKKEEKRERERGGDLHDPPENQEERHETASEPPPADQLPVMHVFVLVSAHCEPACGSLCVGISALDRDDRIAGHIFRMRAIMSGVLVVIVSIMPSTRRIRTF